ncbi:MDR/zinc-dependent alcohol dehydrogenase-like family protein [Altericroceibacterium xinjiangense]|uniref:MDR/zinc-dependent alcohol dehydrogenase-like family protein n=1 Tax=Altericroceibacterium xinjiangense TaxID=762261 RepID=UPI0019D138F4|nr:zinc-binding dehydrogenase [Altericroceibacterium xinjiangense]
MTPTMKAAVLTGPRAFAVQEVERPEPGTGEVRVRLEGCGVCASNLTPWEGPEWMQFPTPPGDLGHEGWGRIEAVGPDVDGLAVGDRVAALSYKSYAEADVAKADMVVKLPPELDGKPFPGEPLGCAFNIFRRSDIKPGQTVAIVGIGFLGAVLCQLASDAGAKVIAISRRPESLDLARRFGAAETVPMDDHWKIIERVKEIAGEGLCERVIECVGKQWPLDLSTELVGFGGKLIVAGYHQDGPRQVNMQTWNWKGIDVINAHERDPEVQLQGVREAVEAVASGRLDPEPLYTRGYRLDDLGKALDDTRDKPGAFVKALVELA